MLEVTYLRCCRDWPIIAGLPVGKCGLCHQRPRQLTPDPDVIKEQRRVIARLIERTT